MGPRLGVLVLAAGCGRIGFADVTADAAPTTTDTAVDTTPQCGPLVEMSDNFDDGILDAKWQTQLNAGVTLDEVGGALRMRLVTSNGNFYANHFSRAPYSLGTCTVAVTVVEVPRAVAGAETAFCLSVQTPPLSQLCFQIGNGSLWSYLNAGSVMLLISQPFDPVAHAHLRFRQDATNIIWETSADGASWVPFDARPPPIDLSQIHVEIFAGTSQNVVNPGQARYEDLIIQ